MTQSRQSNLDHSNILYRDRYQVLMVALIIAMVVLLLMMFVVMYQVSHRKLPLFFAYNPEHQSMALEAFSEPTFRSDVLIRWASKAAVAAYTFDFANYQKQFAVARPYFTTAGWNDYLSSVSYLINTITQNKLFVSSVVSGPPVISRQGDMPDVGYIWRIQIPFLVNYISADQTRSAKYTVIVTLVKVSTAINPVGVGIDQFVMVGG